MNLRQLAAVGVAVAALGGASLIRASAAPVQFATFHQVTTPKFGPFSYNNAGAGSQWTVVPNTAVKFTFNVFNGYNNAFSGHGLGAINNAINATVTFSADAVGPATNVAGVDTELFKNIQMKFTANSAVDGMTNLLTITSSSGTFKSVDFSSLGSLIGDTAKGDTVSFSSDFLTFLPAPPGQSVADLEFANIDPRSKIMPNGYLRNTNANVTGKFSGGPVPYYTPDGNSLWMLAGGVLPLGGIGLRMRRRALKR